jgi:hypothetical protein
MTRGLGTGTLAVVDDAAIGAALPMPKREGTGTLADAVIVAVGAGTLADAVIVAVGAGTLAVAPELELAAEVGAIGSVKKRATEPFGFIAFMTFGAIASSRWM